MQYKLCPVWVFFWVNECMWFLQQSKYHQNGYILEGLQKVVPLRLYIKNWLRYIKLTLGFIVLLKSYFTEDFCFPQKSITKWSKLMSLLNEMFLIY